MAPAGGVGVLSSALHSSLRVSWGKYPIQWSGSLTRVLVQRNQMLS